MSDPGCLRLMGEMNGHQKPTAGDVKGISCSLPRAGYLPDLHVFKRVKESVRKNACAYLLEFKSKLQLEHACVAWICFLLMFKCVSAASVNISYKAKLKAVSSLRTFLYSKKIQDFSFNHH